MGRKCFKMNRVTGNMYLASAALTQSLDTLKGWFNHTTFSHKKETLAETDPSKSLVWAVEVYKGLIMLALQRKCAEL